MGVEIADAWVSIKPSAKGLKQALESELRAQGFEKVTGKEGDKAGKSFGDRFQQATGKSLGDVSKKALFATAAIGGGMLMAANAAGDLEAAISANEQVLGDVSKGIQQWAKKSVQNFGLSERAAIDAASSFGAIGKVAGFSGASLGKFSQDLVGLAADMAAFANVSVTQTLQDLQSGFAGQTEVLRKYNVYLDDAGLKQAYFKQTGEKVTGTLTAQQRIVAINAELWRQTADQQGQAAREAGGFQRAQDNLKATLENAAASIGKSVLPMVTGLVQGITTGIGALGAFNDATGGLVGQMGMLAVAGGGTVGVVAGIGSKISNTITGFKNMSTAMQKASIGAGLVTVAIVAGLSIWSAMGAKEREITARTKELAAAMPAATKEIWNHAEASADAKGHVDGLATAEKVLSQVISKTGDDGKRLTMALGTLGVQTEDTVSLLTKVKDDPVKAFAELGERMGLTGLQALEVGRMVNQSDESWTKWTSSSKQYVETMGTTAPEKVKALADAMEEVQDQAEKTDFDALARENLAVVASSNEAANAMVQQAEKNAGLSRSSSEAAKVWAEYNVLLGQASPAMRAAIQGTEQLTGAQKGLATVQASTITLTSKAEKAFERAADQASAFKSALDRLVGGQVGLQAAQDDLIAGSQQLDKVIDELRKKGELNTDALLANTEAGLANREMIRKQVEGATGFAASMLDTGHSIDETSAALAWNREMLIQQVEKFGLSRAAAEAYIDQLGLTPESIDTAVKLSGDEVAKKEIEAYRAQLDALPASVASRIQAIIDTGDYARAKRMLDDLAMPKTVFYNVRTGQNQRSAWGNYFAAPGFTTVAEDYDPEAVLTLGKPANLKRQLNDPRIGGPIMDALGLDDKALVVAPSSGVHVDKLYTGTTTREAIEAMERFSWLAGAR